MLSRSANSPLWLWGVLLLLVAALAATLAYKVRPLLKLSAVRVAELNAHCDLRQEACRVGFPDGGHVRLDIQPRGIPTSSPLVLSVQIEGLDGGAIEAVEVDFAGVDMYMGFNRVGLAEQSPGLYQGQGMIPVCVRTRMIWEARVLIHTAAGLAVAPYRFATTR